MTKQPDILLLMADQLAPHFLPVYGHPVVLAPNLSELARGGAVFDAAYCNPPLCAPSRFSMMTGRMPSDIGACGNASPLSPALPTFAHGRRSNHPGTGRRPRRRTLLPAVGGRRLRRPGTDPHPGAGGPAASTGGRRRRTGSRGNRTCSVRDSRSVVKNAVLLCRGAPHSQGVAWSNPRRYNGPRRSPGGTWQSPPSTMPSEPARESNGS